MFLVVQWWRNAPKVVYKTRWSTSSTKCFFGSSNLLQNGFVFFCQRNWKTLKTLQVDQNDPEKHCFLQNIWLDYKWTVCVPMVLHKIHRGKLICTTLKPPLFRRGNLKGDILDIFKIFSLNSPIITESSPNNFKLTLNSNRIYNATFKVPHPSWADVRFYIHRGAQFSVPGCHFDEGSSPQMAPSFDTRRTWGKMAPLQAVGQFLFPPLRWWCSKKPHRNGTLWHITNPVDCRVHAENISIGSDCKIKR